MAKRNVWRAKGAHRCLFHDRRYIVMTKPKHYVPALDAIRGVAILGVFLFHALGMAFGFDQLPWKGFYRDFDTWRTFLPLYPLTYGSAGVSVFFVVSGFCIHLSFATSSNQGWMY